MGSRFTALLITFMVFVSTIPQTLACGYCSQPIPNPPKTSHPPYKKPPKVPPPTTKPPIVVLPPVITPPVIHPPGGGYPPYPPSGGSPGTNPPSGGFPGTNPPGSGGATCPIDALKLGLCVDVLGGLVHVGLGDPVQNSCCPVLQGLLELEAAICLCTTIRLKVLNLNIFIPLALQVLITCGMTPPPGFVCPPL